MPGCCLLILAVLLPPLAVFFHRGCDVHFCINIVLTCIGWLPGILHAIYVLYYMEECCHDDRSCC